MRDLCYGVVMQERGRHNILCGEESAEVSWPDPGQPGAGPAGGRQGRHHLLRHLSGVQVGLPDRGELELINYYCRLEWLVVAVLVLFSRLWY